MMMKRNVSFERERAENSEKLLNQTERTNKMARDDDGET